MSGVALNQFADFVEATGPLYVSGPRHVINEAVKNTYSFGRLCNGTSIKKMLRGGNQIRESVFFDDDSTFEFYLPSATHSWRNPQVLTKVTSYYRYAMDHMMWVDQEILNNDAMSGGNPDAKFHAYVDLYEQKAARMWTSIWNGLENALWAAPVSGTMEAEAGKVPYSIPAFINEDTNGLFDPQASSAWTTVHGLDPTDTANSYDKWIPQTETYSSATVGNIGTILGAFDVMWHKVKFERPPTHAQYWENPALNKQMILTSQVGRKAFMHLLREGQDHFVAGPQDPAYTDPQYHGVAVSWVSELDTAALYDSGSSTVVSEATADLQGPRFYWVNGNYLYPVFHKSRYFYQHQVSYQHQVPDTWVAPVAIWYNLLCTSRQRQGIVSPSTDLYY